MTAQRSLSDAKTVTALFSPGRWESAIGKGVLLGGNQRLEKVCCIPFSRHGRWSIVAHPSVVGHEPCGAPLILTGAICGEVRAPRAVMVVDNSFHR